MAKREIGSGITRHLVPEGVTIGSASSEEERRQFADALVAASKQPLWDRTKYIKAFSDALVDLTGSADPDPTAFKAHDDWGWYYSELIRLDRITRNRIERGEAGLAALSACEFGQLFAELQIKLVWEQDALAGRKALEGARLGGERRSPDTARRAHLFSAYQCRLGKMAEPTALQCAAKEAGYSERHARRLIPKPKQ